MKYPKIPALLPCFLLLLFFQGRTQSVHLQSPVPNDPAVISDSLPNGLHYYILYNQKPEKRAELRLVIRAGSLQESENQLGLAHFVEHMAFNGSANFKKNELVDYLESVGTRFGPDLNAYTNFGETVYLLQARTDSLHLLEKGLLILEDWAGGVSFETEEIDKERGVVTSEWRTGLSSDQRLRQQYFPVLYQNSRYAERMPIGDPEIIDTAAYETIRQFYRDWYRPELMAVVAVGDFDTEWMEKEIVRRFSGLQNPAGAPPREEYRVPLHDTTLIVRATDEEAAFTRIRLTYRHPEFEVRNLNDFRTGLLHALYNRMINARLFEYQQKQANPPFTFSYSGYGGDLGNQDVYLISAFTAQGMALTGLEAVLTETYRALRHGFTGSELERQKADFLRAAEQSAIEQDKIPSASLTGGLIEHFLDQSPYPDPEQILALYRQFLPGISVEEINVLPRQWITGKNRTIVVTGPKNDSIPLPSEEALLELLESMEDRPLEPYVDEMPDNPLFAVSLAETPVSTEHYFEDLDVTQLRLANGIRVILKPTDFQNDEILMTAFSPGGHSLYPDADYQSASNAAALMNLGGLGEFSLTDLNKKLAGKEVNVGPYIGELYEGISGSCAGEDLELMLQLTYLYFTRPRKDSVALESFLTRQRSVLENMFTNPYYEYAQTKEKIKYKDHYRRRMTVLEDLEDISLDRALEIYRDRFSDAGDFTFVFVGNFTIPSITPLISSYLGNLPAAGREESWKDIGADLAEGKTDTVLTGGQAPKSLVEIVFHGDFDFENQKRYDFYSMIDVLRIRLREAMREDQGGVYGVRLNGIINQYPAAKYRITISFNADPEEVDSLLRTAWREIEALGREGASEMDLAKVKETQKQSRIKAIKENSFWRGQLAARYRENLPLDGIKPEVYQQYIDRLDATAVRQAAERYFSRENYIQIVLMPEGPQIDKGAENK